MTATTGLSLYTNRHTARTPAGQPLYGGGQWSGGSGAAGGGLSAADGRFARLPWPYGSLWSANLRVVYDWVTTPGAAPLSKIDNFFLTL